MPNLIRAWKSFRAMPFIVQAGAWLALAIVLMLLWPTNARADSEVRRGADWVRITALPCTDAAVVARIQQAGGDPRDWRAASAEFGGEAFGACWQPLADRRTAHLLYSDGDEGLIPLGALKPVRDT